MDTARFDQAKTSIQHLLDNEVSDLVLAGIVSEVRSDGLPQDWVDDVPNLTQDQAAELAGMLEGSTYQWAVSLRGML